MHECCECGQVMIERSRRMDEAGHGPYCLYCWAGISHINDVAKQRSLVIQKLQRELETLKTSSASLHAFCESQERTTNGETQNS